LYLPQARAAARRRRKEAEEVAAQENRARVLAAAAARRSALAAEAAAAAAGPPPAAGRTSRTCHGHITHMHTCTHAHIHAHTDTDTHIHTHARAVHLDILPAVWQPLHELAAHTQGGHCVSRTFCVYFYDTIGAVLARHMFTRSHPAMVQQAAWGGGAFVNSLFPLF
jgi:hypothetical protein